LNQIDAMKTYLNIIIALFITAACNQKQPEKQEAKSIHPLKIKVCRMYSSDFVLLDPNEKGLLMQEFRFNKNGFVNELIRYDLDGEIVGRFDILGENTPFPMPGDAEFVDTVITVLDTESLDIVNGKEIKVYNNKGLLIEVRFYEGQNQLVKKNTYNYDSNRMIKEDVYWDLELDKPKQKIRYEFEYFTN